MAAAADVAAAVQRGAIVALPWSSGALALARASERARLLALPGAAVSALALGSGSVAALTDFLPPTGLRARRLLLRLLPGAVAVRLGGDANAVLVRLPVLAAWPESAREPLLSVPVTAAASGVELIAGEAPADEAVLRLATGQALVIERAGTLPVDDLRAAARVHLLCVCSGNTCRSPMLAALLRAELVRRGIDHVHVDSAGTFAADGQGASAGAQAAMARRGLDLAAHRSRNVEDREPTLYDAVWCMSASHAGLLSHLGVDAGVLHIVAADAGGIPDPFGGSDAAYESCARVLEREALGIVDAL